MTEEQRLFVADARELVERLCRDLEQLRVARSEGRRRRELAAQIFRRVHTLKGSGASLGFRPVSEIAHEFEGVLDGARLGRVELTDAVLDMFEDALDAIARSLQAAPSAKSDPATKPMIRRLHALAETSKKQGAIEGSLRTALPVDIARALSEYDLQHAREAIREGAKLFIVSAGFAIETFDQGFRELSKLLGQSGEIIATVPGEPATADEINFRLLYAAELLSTEVLRQAASLGRIQHSELPVQAAVQANASVEAQAPTPTSLPLTADAPVRIDLTQLDDLISNASELFRQTTNALVTLGGPAKTELVDRTIRNLRGRFVELEERLIKLRLVPAGEVLERAAARAGRIAARQLAKEVEFEIVGGDVGIEKSLAAVISDPLLHLVRNAITHGIENPADRQAAGKNPTGRVMLAASNHSGRIHITVKDDGRGIDMDRIVAAAAEHGISSANLSMDQCLRLIFRPGFSTAGELSEMSGRGIGLDIVDRAMELAGGEVRVATETGAGTTFALIVPAALSMVKCVIVRCGEQLYAIDSGCVSQTDSASGLPPIANSNADFDHEKLPLLGLATLLGGKSTEETNETFVIIWKPPAGSVRENGAKGYRIALDGIVGRQETLVRSLGRHGARWAGVCGAAELFDGSVALVLDLEELIKLFSERQ
jgi:two-component system chemotaxis sensor kinase CheA